MSATKITDLLPIPSGVSKPHAYQVFGLEGGEQDDATVNEAMRRVYANLKQAKPSCDPKLWSQAAQIAEAARKVLESPEQRRELDARFGIVATPSPTTSTPPSDPSSAGSADPLAGILPPTNPLSQSSPAPAAPVAPLGVPPLGTPPMQTGSAPTQAAPASPMTAQPIGNLSVGPATPASPGTPVGSWAPAKPTRKRRKKKSGVFMFGFFVLLMLGAIVGLVAFLKDNGRVVINAPSDPGGVAISDPGPVAKTPDGPDGPPSDGIMGGVASSGATSTPGASSGLSSSNPLDPDMDIEVPAPMIPDSQGMTDGPPMTEPVEPPTPPQPPTPDEPSPETLRENQTRIEAVEQMIREGNFAQMKIAADALEKLPLDADQTKRVRALFDIADLATFYRGALERGLASLTTGATFEIEDGFSVIVVEASKSDLTIRFDRNEKSYTIDTLPERLMERISEIQLERDKADSIAALALYRLIHSTTNQEYRQQAWENLASVDGKLNNVDTAALQQVAKSILEP